MTPNYSTPEFELLKEVDRKQDKLIERLFGDLDTENPKARFPALESEQERLSKRVNKLEIARVKLMTVGGVIGTAFGIILEFFIHHGQF